MPDAFDHCEALVREADKDRFLATLFAPARFRRALYALYAFNVEVARVRSVAREPMAGEIRLQWWRDVLTGAGRGEVRSNPVASALLDTVVRHGLPPTMLVDLIEARAFDLYDDPMPTLAALEAYERKTSGALIELAASILNARAAPDVSSAAGEAGLALATAYLLGAFAAQSARRQLYVPLDVLVRCGARTDDIFAGKDTPELRTALAEIRAHAHRHLDTARLMLAQAPDSLAAAFLPATLARPLLSVMDRRRYDPFKPIILAPWRRQWIIWRAARRGLARLL